MKKAIAIVVNILTVLSIFIGSILLVETNVKIVRTAGELMTINADQQYYNESTRKTDEMTAQYEERDAERKSFYNSDDIVIRVFSNQNAPLKIVILLVSLLMIPAIPLMWVYHILRNITRIKKRAARARERKQTV